MPLGDKPLGQPRKLQDKQRAPNGMQTNKETGALEQSEETKGMEVLSYKLTFPNAQESHYSVRPYFAHNWYGDLKTAIFRSGGYLPDDFRKQAFVTVSFRTREAAERFAHVLVDDFSVTPSKIKAALEYNREKAVPLPLSDLHEAAYYSGMPVRVDNNLLKLSKWYGLRSGLVYLQTDSGLRPMDKSAVFVVQSEQDDVPVEADKPEKDLDNDIPAEDDAPTYGGAKFELPEDHLAGMRVPKGGAMCANCSFLAEDGESCINQDFITWNGGDTKLPAPADSYCSDWFETTEGGADAEETDDSGSEVSPDEDLEFEN